MASIGLRRVLLDINIDMLNYSIQSLDKDNRMYLYYHSIFLVMNIEHIKVHISLVDIDIVG